MPPECEKIQRMSGYFCDVPLNTRCAMVRVLSVAYSIEPGGMPGTVLLQQFGVSGMHVDHCLAAVEFLVDRRKRGSPRYLPS